MTNGGVQHDLFDYVDGYAEAVLNGVYQREDKFDPAWNIFTFCQLFFDQFFGCYGTSISGFSQQSREAAALLIERLRAFGQGSGQTRQMIVLYEEFCDMSDDTRGGYEESSSVSVLTFHEEYLTRLLEASREWAVNEGNSSLVQRIADSIDRYNFAIESTQWLTRPSSQDR